MNKMVRKLRYRKRSYSHLSAYVLLALILSISLVPKTFAHAWRGQEIVLFVSYDLSHDYLKATLGLPLDLIQSNQYSHKQRDNLNLTLLSEQILNDQFLESLSAKVHNDIPLMAQNRKYLAQITKIDCILKFPSSTVDRNQRFLRTWKEIKIETHSGTQDALVISITYPLKNPSSFDRIHFLWQSKEWFVKSKFRRQLTKSTKTLNTREVPGLIIDPQQINPLTFTPQEPEVIWHSPLQKRLSKIRSEQRQILQQNDLPKSWWQRIKTYLTNDQTTNQKDIEQLFADTHRSIYQAFDHDVDEKIYLALSKALHGSILDQVFQSTYNALILREEGGARAKVTHVIPLELVSAKISELPHQLRQKLKSLKLQHFYIFKYHWRVAGLIEHWSHTHRRVNDYQAFYVFAPINTQEKKVVNWKIIALAPISQRRRPELEGSL